MHYRVVIALHKLHYDYQHNVKTKDEIPGVMHRPAGWPETRLY